MWHCNYNKACQLVKIWQKYKTTVSNHLVIMRSHWCVNIYDRAFRMCTGAHSFVHVTKIFTNNSYSGECANENSALATMFALCTQPHRNIHYCPHVGISKRKRFIIKDLLDTTTHGVLQLEHPRGLRNCILELCKSLRKDAIGLVDAFNHPDCVVISPLGR